MSVIAQLDIITAKFTRVDNKLVLETTNKTENTITIRFQIAYNGQIIRDSQDVRPGSQKTIIEGEAINGDVSFSTDDD